MVYYTKFRQPNFFSAIFSLLQKLRIVIFVILIISGSAYFWQVNSLSIRGFKIKELEKSIQQLKEDNEKLEQQFTIEQSTFNLNERIKQLNLVAVDKIEYIQPVKPVVAVK